VQRAAAPQNHVVRVTDALPGGGVHLVARAHAQTVFLDDVHDPRLHRRDGDRGAVDVQGDRLL